jgi:hypothetical protein
MEWIRRNYGVPARHGMHVTYGGRPAVIVGAGGGGYLRLRVEGERRLVWDHPTSRIVYPEVPRPARPRGWCRHCGKDRAMTADGNIGRHRSTWDPSTPCPGTGEPPTHRVEYRTNAPATA